MLPKIQSSVRHFPWDIFGDELYANFREIAAAYSFPLDYLGTQALWCIGALAGNQYKAVVAGGVKPIIYIAKIGPSGVGKTPPYQRICGDIINPLRIKYEQEFQYKLKDYKARAAQVKKASGGQDIMEDPPIKIKRIAESGTLESITKHMSNSPAGFGVIYDEGERFFTESARYAKGGNSDIGFWNEAFNGKTMDIMRATAELERLLVNPAISVDIGLQSDRIHRYFTEDAIDSGILNRFLMVESGYIELNESADPWSQRVEINEDWQKLITYLFNNGINFVETDCKPVQFTEDARAMARKAISKMTRESNKIITQIKEGESTKYISAYRSKLSTYFYRFALIIAIYHNPRNPVIDPFCIQGAEKLCEYYEYTAKKIINRLFLSSQVDLTDQERTLLEELPDHEFTNDLAEAVCERLAFSRKFFAVTFMRKYAKKGLVKRVKRGTYQKQ